MQKGGYVYMMCNKYRTALYIGVTSDLERRISEHKQHIFKNSFTDKYNIEFLVYYELAGTIENAIAREKELKKWSRKKKDELVATMNSDWKDLWDGLWNKSE